MQRLDAAIVLTNDQIGTTGIFINDIIAGFGKLFIARGELPDLRPHCVDLGLMKGRIGIA